MEWIFTNKRFSVYSVLSASIIFNSLSRNVSVPLWLKNNSATMICPFLCVVMIPSGFRARKRDFPWLENPSLLSVILFYCAGGAVACAFFLSQMSRYLPCIPCKILSGCEYPICTPRRKILVLVGTCDADKNALFLHLCPDILCFSRKSMYPDDRVIFPYFIIKNCDLISLNFQLLHLFIFFPISS